MDSNQRPRSYQDRVIKAVAGSLILRTYIKQIITKQNWGSRSCLIDAAPVRVKEVGLPPKFTASAKLTRS